VYGIRTKEMWVLLLQEVDEEGYTYLGIVDWTILKRR